MRPIGFSTGALAHGDYRRALGWLEGLGCQVVELSALHAPELDDLLGVNGSTCGIDARFLPMNCVLRRGPHPEVIPPPLFPRVSIHAPSSFPFGKEPIIASQLSVMSTLGFDIVVHPDAIADWEIWRPFGDRLLIENMDERKGIGRDITEMRWIFDKLPQASWCFDIGHVMQNAVEVGHGLRMKHVVDMYEAFKARLREVHLSCVDAEYKHYPLTHAGPWFGNQIARDLAKLIPESVSIILEGEFGDLTKDALRAELREAHRIFGDG